MFLRRSIAVFCALLLIQITPLRPATVMAADEDAASGVIAVFTLQGPVTETPPVTAEPPTPCTSPRPKAPAW